MPSSRAVSGISDPQVIAIAQAEDRVILTFDKDYGELIFKDGIENFQQCFSCAIVIGTRKQRRTWSQKPFQLAPCSKGVSV